MMNGRSAGWRVEECAAWIETRDLRQVEQAASRPPQYATIKEIERAWRAGEITGSGEVDGASRRMLTADEATDHTILLYTHDGKDEGEAGVRYKFPYEVYPSNYSRNQVVPVGSFLIFVRSLRMYPSAQVHDRRGTALVPLGTNTAIRYRFIQGLLFDRIAVTNTWGKRGHDGFVLDAACNIIDRKKGYREIYSIAIKNNINWEELTPAKFAHAIFDKLPVSAISDRHQKQRAWGQIKKRCARFIKDRIAFPKGDSGTLDNQTN